MEKEDTMSSKFIPAGSYLKTTKDVKVVLLAEAQRKDGSWNADAHLELTDLQTADIENLDGVLHNTGRDAPARNFVPGGSYAQTSRNIRVILTGQAQKIYQSWITAQLNLTDLKAPGDVANLDGKLVDQQK